MKIRSICLMFLATTTVIAWASPGDYICSATFSSEYNSKISWQQFQEKQVEYIQEFLNEKCDKGKSFSMTAPGSRGGMDGLIACCIEKSSKP